jgi:hypothetical protein
VAEARNWTRAEFDDATWGKVSSLGKLGINPWGNPFATTAKAAPAEKRLATPAESLTTLPGFRVELLRSAEPGEGSWVAMTADPKGRLIVSPQGKEPMLRVTLDAAGRIAQLERIELPVSGAMGLLHAFDALYVNGNGPDGYHLYRLTDSDGDDKFDKVQLLRKWQGGTGEHGAHGIVRGPDDHLYVVCGNFVGVPEDISPASPHRNYADDLVLPRAATWCGWTATARTRNCSHPASATPTTSTSMPTASCLDSTATWNGTGASRGIAPSARITSSAAATRVSGRVRPSGRSITRTACRRR